MDQLQLPLWYQIDDKKEFCPATGDFRYIDPKDGVMAAIDNYEEKSREYNQWEAWIPASITAGLYLVGKLALSYLGGDNGLESIMAKQLDNAVAFGFMLVPFFLRLVTDIPYKSEVKEAKQEMQRAEQMMLQYVLE